VRGDIAWGGGKLVHADDGGVVQHRADDVGDHVQVRIGRRQARTRELLHYCERRVLLCPHGVRELVEDVSVEEMKRRMAQFA
jgi:hypothetical protein